MLLLLRLQGYQSCDGAGMLAPGLANAVVAQHFVLGGLPTLKGIGSLLKKLLFLGRTLLLRLWASKPVLIQECWLQG